MMNSPKKTSASWRRLRYALVPIVLLAGACASAPPAPTASLQAAQQAIASAERVDAGTHAAAELGEARGKLSSAQAAVEQEHMVVAGRFADEARVAADLASAKAGAAKAKAVNHDIERSNATLVEEMQRSSGGTR